MHRSLAVACWCFVLACATGAQEVELAPVEGGELAYVVRGNGEPVLLIHGGLIGLSSYGSVMKEPTLADYRLIRYARRGYPPSSAHNEPTSLAQQAADAAMLLAHLGVQRAHVVGHSAGGPIAVQLAVDRPDLVHSLTLLEGAPWGPPAPAVPPPAGPNDATPAFVALGFAGDYEAAAPAFMEWLYGPEWRTDDAIADWRSLDELAHTLPMFFQNEIAMYGRPVASDHYSRVASPIVVVMGELSLATEGAAVYKAPLDLLPKAERVELPGTDHAMLARKPREVAATIAAFVARHPM